MILTANEARRLLNRRWQAQLYVLDSLIREAISKGKCTIKCRMVLLDTAKEWLVEQGYKVVDKRHTTVISWGV